MSILPSFLMQLDQFAEGDHLFTCPFTAKHGSHHTLTKYTLREEVGILVKQKSEQNQGPWLQLTLIIYNYVTYMLQNTNIFISPCQQR